jgi:hypothetical protein
MWNPTYEPLPQSTIDDWYNNIEAETGRRFNRADLTAAGVRSGPSGAVWRGIDVTAKGRHWAIPGFVRHLLGDKETPDALDALDAAGPGVLSRTALPVAFVSSSDMTSREDYHHPSCNGRLSVASGAVDTLLVPQTLVAVGSQRGHHPVLLTE